MHARVRVRARAHAYTHQHESGTNQSHPLTPELSAKLFAQKGIGAFLFLAALIEWSQSELQGLQKIWVQACKNAWHVPWSTANSLYTLPTAEGGHECPTLSGLRSTHAGLAAAR